MRIFASGATLALLAKEKTMDDGNVIELCVSFLKAVMYNELDGIECTIGERIRAAYVLYQYVIRGELDLNKLVFSVVERSEGDVGDSFP